MPIWWPFGWNFPARGHRFRATIITIWKFIYCDIIIIEHAHELIMLHQLLCILLLTFEHLMLQLLQLHLVHLIFLFLLLSHHRWVPPLNIQYSWSSRIFTYGGLFGDLTHNLIKILNIYSRFRRGRFRCGRQGTSRRWRGLRLTLDAPAPTLPHNTLSWASCLH